MSAFSHCANPHIDLQPHLNAYMDALTIIGRTETIPISLNLPEKQTIIVIDRFYMAVKRILHKDLSKRALIIAKLNVKSSYGKRILLSKDILVSIYCNDAFKKVPPYRAAGLFIDEESIIGSVFSLH
jgi:hypothetical protein